MRIEHGRTLSRIRTLILTLPRTLLRKLVNYRRMFVVEIDTSSEARLSVEKEAGFNVRLANYQDVQGLRRFPKFRDGEAEKRLKSGHLCFVAEKDGEVHGYAWVCFHQAYVEELETKIRIGQDSAYRYDVFISNAHRGQGIFPVIFVESCNYLFRNGIMKLYGIVDSDNFSMQRALQKTGSRSRRIGEITYIRLFRQKKYVLKAETNEDRKLLRDILHFDSSAALATSKDCIS